MSYQFAIEVVQPIASVYFDVGHQINKFVEVLAYFLVQVSKLRLQLSNFKLQSSHKPLGWSSTAC